MYIALNASSKLTGVVGVGVTTVPVTAGTGTQFAVGSNHSYVTFQDASNTETCKITGQSGDNLTVVRTKALSWAIGTVIECRPCAEAMADYAVAPQIDGSGAAAIADADSIGFVDASASNVLAKITWANIKATLKTYFDTLYRLVTDDVTLAAGKAVVFEGTTDDAFETTLSAGDPTADRALVLPDKSGTLAVTTDLVGSGQLLKYTKITSTDVTWAKQAGTNRIVVCCKGGGGAGGGNNTAYSAAAEGGFAGCEVWGESSSLTATFVATVGAGGTGVSGASGNAGGTTSFTTSTPTTIASALGGKGGQYSTLSRVYAGQLGMAGHSGEGVGGLGTNAAAGGAAAANSCAGGGGCSGASGANLTGGAGGSGVIHVWEFS